MTGEAGDSQFPNIVVNGESLFPLPCGGAYWPARRTLLVADLHFEKGSSFARRGVMLPPYDTRATLAQLRKSIDQWRPATVISLGDSFHDPEAEARMAEDDVAMLQQLTTETEWIWLRGNHDPAPSNRFAGEVRESVRLGGLFLTHEPKESPEPGEVAGHLHPCARVILSHGSLRRRCFIADRSRLIMPSYGAFTGGLNVLDSAISGLFGGFAVWIIGSKGVYPVSTSRLVADRQFDWQKLGGERRA